MVVRLRRFSGVGAYALGVQATAAAVFVRWLADPWLGDSAPLITLYGAVAVAIGYGGLLPAMMTAILGYLACNFAFMEPRGVIAITNAHGVERLLLYVLTCSIITGVGEALRIARRRAEVNWQYAVTRQNELRAEVARRRSAEHALRSADRHKDEFLAILAHELRNPLAAAKGAVELLRRANGDSKLAASAQGAIERQLSHLTRLADDLLDMARIAKGKVELQRQRVDLADVCHQAIETTRPLIEQMAHELIAALPAEPIYVDADPVRISQVVSNLLTNAAKYTPQGGHIWLTLEPRGREAVVSVKDTGVGIHADMLHRVFDIFTQVDTAREGSHGGLGLGLALAKQLTELHGGSIEVHSEGAGKGSELTVRLPMPLGLHVEEPMRDQAGSVNSY
jgi:signal transduction histidine kinase